MKFLQKDQLKVHFCTEDVNETKIKNIKENYRFESRFLPKLNTELKYFEEDMFNLVKNLKLKKKRYG